MSDLRDLLQGAGEAKLQLFASEDFAGGYGRSIVSRVKRRRAVSASAMGGGTAVAVGALAVAVTHVPFASLGLAGPGSAVVCATTFATPTRSADKALSLGHVPSPSGSLIWAVAVGSEDPPNIVANIALDLETHEVTGSIPDGNSLVLTPDPEGVYAVQFSDGNRLSFVVEAEELVLKSSTLEPTGAPTVTCVTITPEPSASVSPVSQTSTTPAALAKPSPFQCGYTFSTTGRSNADVTIGYVEWVTADEAEATIRAEYEDPEAAELQLSGDRVPVAQIQVADKWSDDNVPGVLVSGDPADIGEISTADQFRDGLGTYQVGVQFVLADDGIVVATVQNDGGDRPQYMTTNQYGALLYGLDLEAGMAACDGVNEATLADAEVVAVAGINYIDGDEIKGPYYAWNEVTER